jgi:ABC-type lipoprotein release transport system permease subunit
MGIYLSLGMTLKSIMTYQIIQLLILGTAGAILSVFFGYMLIPILDTITQNLIPFPLKKHLEVSTIQLSIGSLLIGLPLIAQINNIKPSILFSAKVTNNLQKIFGFGFHLFLAFYFCGAHLLGKPTPLKLALYLPHYF